MIFKMMSVAFKGNEFRKDPKEFLGGEMNGLLNGMAFMPFIVPGLFIILFFILGYTDLLTGPYGFFKFVFWIAFIPFVSILYFVLKALRMMKQINKKVVNKTMDTIHVKVEVKE